MVSETKSRWNFRTFRHPFEQQGEWDKKGGRWWWERELEGEKWRELMRERERERERELEVNR